MSTRYSMGGCPACSGERHTEVAGTDDLRRELELLWTFHTTRARPHTPPAMLHDRASFSQRPPLRLVQCDACTLLFRNPREHEETLAEIYAGEAPTTGSLQALHDNQRAACAAQLRRLTHHAGRSGRGLEVGSYVGAFLAAARDGGWRFDGVDVNAVTNEFTAALGFDVVTGTLDDVAADRRYDAVCLWNCFDQLPDPLEAARQAHARLARGGVLAVRVPNGAFYARWRPSLQGPLAAAATAVLAHNNLLAFPYRHGFTPTALRLLLERAGFRIVRGYGDALVPVGDRWTRPWARMEERVLKAAMRRLPAAYAPWLEVYAQGT